MQIRTQNCGHKKKLYINLETITILRLFVHGKAKLKQNFMLINKK